MSRSQRKTRRQFLKTTAIGALGALQSRGLAFVHPKSSTIASLRTSSSILNVSENGAFLTVGPATMRRVVKLQSTVEGYSQVSNANVQMRDGVIERRTKATSPGGEGKCELIELFSNGGSDSIRWELEIHSLGPTRTAPIHMIASYPATSQSKFWAAWSDPVPPITDPPAEEAQWKDPLILMPFVKRRLFYGAPYFTYDDPKIGFMPLTGDLIGLPLASFLEPAVNDGFTMVLSPDVGDGLLDLTLDTDANGVADFAFHHHRLSAERQVRLCADFVCHEADWRGGLRWMTKRHSRYFVPKLAGAQQLDGTAAYSKDNDTGHLDVAKLKKMGFRTNWKASFDFPYMGMFLPPVTNESWPRFSGDSSGKEKTGTDASNGFISIKEMAEYSERMRAAGFFVLNYFNVSEFGANVIYPPPPRSTTSEDGIWKHANDFLYERLEKALLHVPEGMPDKVLKFYPGTKTGGLFYTWGNGVILDCGEPEYQDFLLQQARLHIDKLPASSGICIDRMDWLRLYNERRDDGVSWLADRPVRSLYISWRQLMSKLLPMMHDANKVVFVNNHPKRIDLLRDIDGIYDEFALNGASLNLTALLAVSRPALGWTNDEESIRTDPDRFFQRFLYMGVFPTAPFPGNDHSIIPSTWAESQYLEYGPLLNALHGREWVLEPHAIEVPGGEAVANLFSVGDSYVIPVMLGGTSSTAKVSLCLLPDLKQFRAEVLHPGHATPMPLPSSSSLENRIVFDVPLVRGCALLRLQPRAI